MERGVPPGVSEMILASWVSVGGASEGNVATGRSLVLSYGLEKEPGDVKNHSTLPWFSSQPLCNGKRKKKNVVSGIILGSSAKQQQGSQSGEAGCLALKTAPHHGLVLPSTSQRRNSGPQSLFHELCLPGNPMEFTPQSRKTKRKCLQGSQHFGPIHARPLPGRKRCLQWTHPAGSASCLAFRSILYKGGTPSQECAVEAICLKSPWFLRSQEAVRRSHARQEEGHKQ